MADMGRHITTRPKKHHAHRCAEWRQKHHRDADIHAVVTRGSPRRHIDPVLAGAIVGGDIGV
jgi:hypothetical protein